MRLVLAAFLAAPAAALATPAARAGPGAARQAGRKGDLQPGDLVFYNTRNSAYSHVGIYVGDGRFIHAPRRGARVRAERVDSPYWAERFNGARRLARPA